MSYDYIVVGGGISGVFLTYKLQETGRSILLIESGNRLGGKLLLNREKGFNVELGGARFSSTHEKVLTLVNELELTKDMIELPSDDDIVYKMKDKVNMESLHKKILTGSKDFSKKYLQGITYRQLCYDILGQDITEIYQNMFGYDSEFLHLNAHAMLKMYGKDLLKKSTYYILKNGYESLIEKMKDSFKDNVEIKMDTEVNDIGNNYVLCKKTKYYYKKLSLCIPQKSLQRMNYFRDNLSLNSVTPIPLLRIYMKYPLDNNNKPWFKNIKRTITDKYIRHIIPINYDEGTIMISYTDGDLARMWNDLVKLGNNILVKKVHEEIKRLFKIEPPKPLKIKCAYWNEGVHMWKAGVNIKEEYEKIIEISPKIFIATESYSMHQCWVEGCLDVCYDVLEKLDSNYKRDNPKKILDKKVKLYSIDEVLKQKNWIILELNDKKKIYDVKNWLSKHPGGKDNLMKGITANNHYKDSKKYPQSPTDLFSSIGAHKSGKVIQNMLKKENEFVVFVGLLKKI